MSDLREVFQRKALDGARVGCVYARRIDLDYYYNQRGIATFTDHETGRRFSITVIVAEMAPPVPTEPEMTTGEGNE